METSIDPWSGPRAGPRPARRSAAQAQVVGDSGGLDAAGYPELAQDVRDVDGGGAGADEQPLPDLPVGEALPYQAQHGHLASGQPILGACVASGASGPQLLRHQPGQLNRAVQG